MRVMRSTTTSSSHLTKTPIAGGFSSRACRRSLGPRVVPQAIFSPMGTWEEDGMGDVLPLQQVHITPAAHPSDHHLKALAAKVSEMGMMTSSMDEDGMAGDSPFTRLAHDSDVVAMKASSLLGSSGLQFLKAAGQVGKAAAATAANLAHNAAAHDPMFDSTMSDSEDGEASGTLMGRMANAGLAAMKNQFVLKAK